MNWDDMTSIITASAALVIFFFVALMVLILRRNRARRKRDLEGLSVGELKSLESKNLLTPEELKSVRQAMARQYLEDQEQRKPALPDVEGRRGIELLALEAQRADSEVMERRMKGDMPRQEATPHRPALEVRPPSSVPDGPPPEEKPAASPEPAAPQASGDLPTHLQNYANISRLELEDMKFAGFISDEDFERILKARGETA